MRKRPQGWHSRGYLPHFDGGEIPQFLTFRLAGTLPRHVFDQWKWELRALTPDQAKAEIHRRADRLLDEQREGLLAAPELAGLVEQALLHFDSERYRLHAWTIMPNHVHVIVTPQNRISLGEMVRSWKLFSAIRGNRLLGNAGALWAPDYFDRYMRNDKHYRATVSYVEQNPVVAGLCRSAEEWLYGSARRRLDATE
jgi:REP element-mobilizing transposase RayT